MSYPEVALGTLMAVRAGTIDPSQYPEETFCLYSIPAFDVGHPEVLRGLEIGSAKQIVRPGDVLLSRIVPHIRRAWVVEPDSNRRIIASGEWIVFRSPNVEPRYLRHFLTSDRFHRQFMRTVVGVGGSLLRARPSQVACIQIPLPPLSEQRRIADILDKGERIRRKRKQSALFAEQLLQSVFLNMVGPSAEGYAEWPVRTLESLAAIGSNSMRTGPFGSDLLHSEFVPRGIAVLGIDNAVQNRFAWGERRYITPEKYERLRRYTVLPSDVIVTIMGTTGRSAVIPDDIPTAITTKHLASITLDRRQAEPEFVSQALFRHPEVLGQIAAANRGAIMSGLNLGLIKGLRLPVPPVERQRDFKKMTAKIRSLAMKMEQTGLEEELFCSLLYHAFSKNVNAGAHADHTGTGKL
jgi:type I restriction enzyme, S subunit